MSRVIAVLNPKGGSGKSTLSTNLACYLDGHLEGGAVLVDSDPQGTARDWAASSPPGAPLPLVVGVDRAQSLEREVRKLSASHGAVVIDGSAHVADSDAASLRVADLVLIPVQPSNADIWGALDLVELVRARQSVTGGRPAAYWVVSRQVAGTNLAAEVGAALEEAGVPVLPHRTTQRVAYTEALNRGLSVLDGSDAKARAEVEAIAGDVLDLLPVDSSRTHQTPLR